MKTQRTQLDFTDQALFIGMDVHKEKWSITTRANDMLIKKFSMEPDPGKLIEHLKSNYPNGEYHSVYEAGFCGYHIDRALRAGGVKNIIVNPAHVPTTYREKLQKTDPVDSRKLARELENGTLQHFKMYIPTLEEEGFRSFCRLRKQQTKDQARVKARIKSLLNFIGVTLPDEFNGKPWSQKLITYLSGVKLPDPCAEETLHSSCRYLQDILKNLAQTKRSIKKYINADPEKQTVIKLLCTVPGIGFTSAIVLYSELMKIERFPSNEKLCCYVGLTPDIRESGEKSKNLGLSKMHLKYVRNTLIESSWTATRNDPVMLECYGNYRKRMDKKKAIIKIARKLLNRIACVWRTKQPYVKAVVS